MGAAMRGPQNEPSTSFPARGLSDFVGTAPAKFDPVP